MSQRDNLELLALPDMLTYVSLGVWCPNLAPWCRCFAQDEITVPCGWLPSTAPRQNTVTAPSLQMWHFCFILALLTFKIPVQSRHKFKSEVTQGLLWILAVLHTCYLYKFNKCGKREEAHLWEILMQLIKLIFNPTVQKLEIYTQIARLIAFHKEASASSAVCTSLGVCLTDWHQTQYLPRLHLLTTAALLNILYIHLCSKHLTSA